MQSTLLKQDTEHLTIDEFCAKEDIKQSCFFKYVRLGKIRTIKRFGRRLIPVEEAKRIHEQGTG
jgi:predicted site-specific integrase-resolvase